MLLSDDRCKRRDRKSPRQVSAYPSIDPRFREDHCEYCDVLVLEGPWCDDCARELTEVEKELILEGIDID